MEAAKNNYAYRPLTESGAIRLIELHPSSDLQARPVCTLRHTTLSELDDEIMYHYCALSYVWGSSKDKTPIVVDGKELRVTINLATALRHLRDSRIISYLWADAICINQDDDQEKAIQVTQMGEVYKAARHTIIWLGEATVQTDEMLSCIRDARKQIQAWKGLRRTDASGEPDVSDGSDQSESADQWGGSEASEEDDSLDLEGLEVLIDLPWFTRVWIYQELIFSPDPWLQCGRTRVRWMDLSTVVQSLSHQDKLSEPCQRFLTMDKAREDFNAQLKKRNRSRVLLDTLVARLGLGVSDPRDMIFAHLGIVVESPLDGTPEEWNLLRADYKKGCSELYRDVAKYLSNKIEIFELLSHVEATSDQRYPDIPSWAPNWMANPLPPPYRRLQDAVATLRKQYEESYGPLEDRLNDSSGSLLLRILPKSYKLWLSPSIISFLGFRMGTITRLSDIISHHGGSLNPDKIYASSQDPTDLHSGVYQEIYSRWWNIFCPIVEERSEFETMFRLAVDRLRTFQKPAHLTDNDLFLHILLHETTPNNDASYPHFLYGRKFALVPECGLAVVPSAARIGDVACFFLEKTAVPVLLRPMSTAPSQHLIDSKIRDVFKLRNSYKSLDVNHFEIVGQCILQDFIFSSLDGRYFADLSGQYYPGTFEAFVIH
jgi:hypothetical protein